MPQQTSRKRKVSVGVRPAQRNSDRFFFRVSSGLKSIIGRDLILDEFVAIFELVKNAFDANAKRVELIFANDRLYIVDNGKGMSRSDIEKKWLFVAYSAKRDNSEDAGYRDKINNPKVYAGSKGVGRFSCDRLGARLRLQSRTAAPHSEVEIIEVDWGRFERDDKEEFAAVPILHSTSKAFDLPKHCTVPRHGTILEIQELRQVWERKKLLALKAALAKLINPFGASTDTFEIYVNAPSELSEDDRLASGIPLSKEDRIPEDQLHKIVNGAVKNFIFDTLREKTTYIDVEIVENGKSIESSLVDRGELIYQIREPNNYTLLVEAGFKCQLFFLNSSAKTTFARRMGIPSPQFGSVFLFRNGFRVFPVGEDGDDTLGLDRRKQQGYNRFLGTREVIGRIDVSGGEEHFKEASSRDKGLIYTDAYKQLLDCFWDKCLKRLERYVVDISWKDLADKDYSSISRMLGDRSSAKITNLIAQLADSKGVILLKYSPHLVRILNEKSADFETSLRALRIVAERTGNEDLVKRVKKAEIRYKEIQKREVEAKAKAERERIAREAAEAQAKAAKEAQAEAEAQAKAAKQAQTEAETKTEEAKQAQEKAENAYQEEKKRSLFLASMTSIDSETIINLHHQIVIYASEVHSDISNQFDRIQHKEPISQEQLLEVFERLDFKNQQILAVSRFATRANFRLDSEQIEADIATFIEEYLQKVCLLFTGDNLEIKVTSATKGLMRKFKPIEVSMLLDNLISNSQKAGATLVSCEITQPKANEVVIAITDDGSGIDPTILEPQRIFERGFTTSQGSGLGLYYVRYILDQMRGSIEADLTHDGGARFLIRIFK